MSVPFKLQSTCVCLRCRQRAKVSSLSLKDCGRPDYMVPDTAFILMDKVYSYIELSEEGQLVGYGYLGTRKELGIKR